MKEFEFKRIVKEVLNKLGIEVTDIIRKNARTPDFEACDKNSRYVIELKIKGDDPKQRKKEVKSLAQGEIVSSSIPTGPRNRLYGIVKEGVQQMIKHDPKHDAFHVIWLHSTGRDAGLFDIRFRATLFGMQNLFSTERPNIMTCYYFHESIFYSCRDELDGAILSCFDESGLKIQLCINTLSPNIQIFRESDLYKNLSEGLCDPDLLHEAIVADCDLDRKKIDEIMEYLRKKYELNHLQPINMQRHSAMVALPDESS